MNTSLVSSRLVSSRLTWSSVSLRSSEPTARISLPAREEKEEEEEESISIPPPSSLSLSSLFSVRRRCLLKGHGSKSAKEGEEGEEADAFFCAPSAAPRAPERSWKAPAPVMYTVWSTSKALPLTYPVTRRSHTTVLWPSRSSPSPPPPPSPEHVD